MFGLLQGLKVIDLTTVALGPYATQILGDFGAGIIKIESKEGDILRAVRPGRRADIGVGFMNFNRNKRSVVIDLKRVEGQSVLHRLVRDADVFVHNMRPRSAANLGVSADKLLEINPGLVYCYSPGFGGRGPDADAPAYDDIIQARSGLASLNADDGGAPLFVRTIACDKIVGLHLAIAVMGGVIGRQRTGKGVVIEVPMLETMTTFLLAEHLAGQTLIPPEGGTGYERVMSRHRRPYKTRDGYLAILPYTTRHWVRFFLVCGLEDWAGMDMVLDPVLRSEHVDELYGKVAELALTRTTDEWEGILVDQDIPCSRVSTLDDLFTDPHVVAAGIFHEASDDRLGRIRELRSPFEVDGCLGYEAAADRAAPGLGEHTAQVLAEAGYAADAIEALKRDGVVA